jgi:hypothetical protein
VGLLAMREMSAGGERRSGRRVRREGGRDTPGYWEHAELGGKGCRMLKGTASRKMSAILSSSIVEISASPLLLIAAPFMPASPTFCTVTDLLLLGFLRKWMRIHASSDSLDRERRDSSPCSCQQSSESKKSHRHGVLWDFVYGPPKITAGAP